ncbi:aspartate aminotransferase family protein [Nocardia beijingensis]|uniref:pyridoxal phosphate-dependent decarboxylase family protein n=1 Tax=Nocardia beijingensis TaxID=95162 RepID=UPI0018954A0B|nr:aminotransferase class I/II-fold pyridoxal phosphate-dependent enzyme [Nocardia beijingensis]MBF6468507.1 aspartate aminotransferase family protein [Nocardia beijingensis]
MDLMKWLGRAVDSALVWEASFGGYESHPDSIIGDQEFGRVFEELTERLGDSTPFFHPRYAGQMTRAPHPAAIVGYVAAMLLNPNNHDFTGGPATTQMEHEVVQELATMFSLPTHIGHLTSSGTIANLEALFVARQSHPGRGVVFSADAHFTHDRMCDLLGMPAYRVQTDPHGRIDLDAVEELVRTGAIGTVVLTAGTTGVGAIDSIADALILKERYGVRLHVDAAYGGFFALLADDDDKSLEWDPAPWRAICGSDSIVVDPHKHGLQPYGCGAVLFTDPAVARHYRHDSPYTRMFAGSPSHLGEISLECSRAGASAAALWTTLRVYPLRRDGLGTLLASTRRAALRFARKVEETAELTLYQQPQLDIVTYLPSAPRTLSGVDEISARMVAEGMSAEPGNAVFLSALRVDAADFGVRGHCLGTDVPNGRILRSALMKPEHELCADDLVTRIAALVPTDSDGAPS